MKILFVDCSAGMSGDMSVGALLDLGVNPDYLISELKKLPVGGYHVHITKRTVRGISGTDFDVILNKEIKSYWTEEESTSHSHHHEGSEHDHHHDHAHHHHDHGHEHDHHHHDQPGVLSTHAHTSWRQIRQLIQDSNLNDNVKAIAIKIFTRVAEAEAKVHGMTIEDVHFHEVGAVDSIVDIVSVAICMDYLKADWVVVSPVNTGSGTIKCRHGVLSVPAPATSEILATKKAFIYSSGIQGELITPTGAAIACEMANDFAPMPLMQIEKIGYGTGKKDFGIPAVLKMVVGTVNQKVKDSVVIMETSVENMHATMDSFVMGEVELGIS